MSTLISILIFVVVLVVLVLVHEFGHFFIAKKTGMRVDEFGVGFPPRLASFKWGETVYSINALPLGGFVRIYGEEASDASARPSEESLERSEQRYPEGVQHRYSEDGDDFSRDSTRSFSGKSKWAQALVLLAGIAANILFAWLLFIIALSNGILTSVSPEDATPQAHLYITGVIQKGPAEAAHVPSGAIVTSLAAQGHTIMPRSPEAFRLFVQESEGAPITMHYTYQSKQTTVEIVPAKGVLDEAKDTAAIGVSLDLAEIQSLPLHKAITEGFMMTVRGIRDIAVGLFSLLASAVTFHANLKDVAGPIGIFRLVGEASALGLTTLLLFMAFISLNLAVINVLPFPALDGGRLLFVIIEKIKGSPISSKAAYYTNTIGFAVLILLVIAITFNDIVRLV